MEVPRGMEPTGTNGRTRHTLSDPCGSGLVLWWFSRWMARNAVSCGHDDDTGKAFIARVRCPVPGPPRPESVVWLVPLPAAGFPVGRFVCGFAVVMAQVRRPVPFRTRKLRPGTAMVLHSRGCGRVARRRIQLSGPSGRVPCGIPGRSFFLFRMGVPVGRNAPGTPIFTLCFAGQPTGAPQPGAGRLFLFPVGSVCFGLPKGIFVVPQRLLVNRYFFRNVLLTRYMIRFAEYGLWNGIGKDGNDVPEHRSAACTM